MDKKLIRFSQTIVLGIYILFGCISAKSQTYSISNDGTVTRILFIFDASQSMLSPWESGKKINIARKFLTETVDSLQNIPNVELALRVYGHQSPVPPQDCSDTRLEVPFGPNSGPKIKQELSYLRPKGTTPLARSLEVCINDFPKEPNTRNIVILITDGIEACDGDPCEISMQLQKSGIILKPFVIGIGIDENFANSFNCIGEYFNASKEESFKSILKVVISQALHATSVQVNLLDSYGNPTESDVNMTFYDKLSGKVMHNYMHTITNRGEPDTIQLDPLVKYRMVVNTLPPISLEEVNISKGKHNVIAVDAPQGMLNVISNAQYFKDLHFSVNTQDNCELINIQQMYHPEKYIVGKYTLEIPTVPVLKIEDVEISQSTTTTVEVPKPGLVTFLSKGEGYGSLYKIESTGEQNWVYNLNLKATNESVQMLEGDYIVVYRPKEAKSTIYTYRRYFSVKPGATYSIKLY